MITISRSLIRELKTVFSRGLGITSRQTGPPVELLVDQDGLWIRTRNQQIALEYRLPLEGLKSQHVVSPFGLLRCCHGVKSDQVQLQVENDKVRAEWQDAGIPQSIEYPVVECEGFPELPDQLECNESRLMVALGDACETATTDSARYALDHLQLRGSEGQVISTDGRQLLIQDDFQFPWEGELLVPANRLLCCRELRRSKSVDVGSTAEWVVFRSGPWTVWLRINEKARFPDVMELVNQGTEPVATLQVPDKDADFICSALKPRPFHQGDADKVTLDLNGEVTVRAREEASFFSSLRWGQFRRSSPVPPISRSRLSQSTVRPPALLTSCRAVLYFACVACSDKCLPPDSPSASSNSSICGLWAGFLEFFGMAKVNRELNEHVSGRTDFSVHTHTYRSPVTPGWINSMP